MAEVYVKLPLIPHGIAAILLNYLGKLLSNRLQASSCILSSLHFIGENCHTFYLGWHAETCKGNIIPY